MHPLSRSHVAAGELPRGLLCDRCNHRQLSQSATNAAKLRYFFDTREAIGDGVALFASTEIAYLI